VSPGHSRAGALCAGLLLAGLSAACGGGGSAGRSCPSDSAGVPVSGSGPGEWARFGLRPRWSELWRRDLPAWAGPGAGRVRVAAGLQEEVALVGSRPGQLRVLARGGTPAPGWEDAGPASAGPGEATSRVLAARWTRDGRLLLLAAHDTVLRLVSLRRGRPPGSGRPVALPGRLRDGATAPRSWELGPDGAAYLRAGPGSAGRLLRVRPGSEHADTLAALPPGAGGPGSWAVGPHGRAVVARPGPGLRLTVLGTGGRAERLLCRSGDGAAAAPRVLVGAEGRVWSGSADGRWEIFGPGGRYLGSVTAPAGSRPVAASGRTMWALLEPPPGGGAAALAAYRLELAGGPRAAGVGSGR